MKTFIALATLCLTSGFAFQAQADSNPTTTCSNGTSFASVSVSEDHMSLYAGLCQGVACAEEMNHQGKLFHAGQYKVTYQIDGSKDNELLISYNPAGMITKIEHAEKQVIVETFRSCHTR